MSLANRTGKIQERMIEGALLARGLAVHSQHILPVQSIYGKWIRVDMFIPPCLLIPNGLIIESRWQNSYGSAEEKLPYLVINIKERYTHPTIIISDGDGLSYGARRWLMEQIDGTKLCAVYTNKELIQWVSSI